MDSTDLAMPQELLPLAGQIIDVDTHETLPINHWEERYGPVVNDFAAALTEAKFPIGILTKDVDDTVINAETVWKNKRLDAPGAFDFHRRLDVMNLTGVGKQIVFPGAMGLMTMMFYGNAGNPNLLRSLGSSERDRRAYAMQLMDAYNQWCVRTSAESDRYYPVAILAAGTAEEYVAKAKSLVDQGVTGLWMPASHPPAGLSPADNALDPLWDILSAARVPLLLHVGADAGFLKNEVWNRAAAFDGFKMGDEFSLDPWTVSSMNRPTENFVTTMILGGVFERHPGLMCGAMEVGADWIGPLAKHLDMWIQNSGVFIGATAKKPELKMAPSEYIRRNVRVAPFYFEDIGEYITMYGLPEVYCYQSDFPHLEGGRDPMGDLTRSFVHHGHGMDVIKQFYVDNAKALLPH